MKTPFCLLLLLLLSCRLQAQSPVYDSTLARKLGADDNGMRSYILAILKTGTAKIEDQSLRDSLFKGHFKNINMLSDQGKLVVAGPIGKNDNHYRGIFILTVSDPEEAKALLRNDPTISEKIFEVDYYKWYGSAALPEYLEVHKKIEKTK